MKKNYLNTAQDFYKIYEEQILPIFKYFEPERKLLFKEITEKKQYFKKNLIIALIMLVVIVSLLRNLNIGIIDLIIFSALIETIAALLIFGKNKDETIKHIKRDYKKEINFFNKLKTECLPKILKVFGDIEWLGNNKLDYSIIPNGYIKKSQINYFGKSYIMKDEYRGTYNGVSFKISERVSSSKGANNTEVFILLESNKTAKTTVLVETKKATSRKKVDIIVFICMLSVFIVPLFAGIILPIICSIFFSYLSSITEKILVGGIAVIGFVFLIALILIGIFLGAIIFVLKKDFSNMKKNEVNVEDVNIEKKYNIICQDQVEARYLVTTAFIERFQKLKVGFEADEISCSFFDNNILIYLITKKNLFEIGDPRKSLLDPEPMKNFYNEIYSIYSIIDVLKLDEKTGL